MGEILRKTGNPHVWRLAVVQFNANDRIQPNGDSLTGNAAVRDSLSLLFRRLLAIH